MVGVFLALPGDSGAFRGASPILGHCHGNAAAECRRNGDGIGQCLWKCGGLRGAVSDRLVERQISKHRYAFPIDWIGTAGGGWVVVFVAETGKSAMKTLQIPQPPTFSTSGTSGK